MIINIFPMSETLTSPLDLNISDTSLPDPSTSPSPDTNPPSSKHLNWRRLALIVIILTLIFGSLISIYLFYHHQQAIYQANKPIYNSHTLNVDDSISKLISLFQREPPTPNPFQEITELILSDPSLRLFDTTLFPNLRHFVIGENVTLDSLVINNSQLTEFSYVSNDLKSLKLVNNTKMKSFVNSTLPVLELLNVTQTSINFWGNNKFGKLKELEFRSSLIGEIPNLDGNIQVLVVRDCGNLTVPDNFNEYFSNVQTIEIVNNLFYTSVNFVNMNKLVGLTFVNNSFNKNLAFVNCSILEELVVEGSMIFNVTLVNLPRLYFFNPKIQTVEMLTVNNTNINEFIIETKFLDILIIQGPTPRRIQPNITHLTAFFIYDNMMNDTQFSQIQLPTVSRLILSNCTNLKKLNNTFTTLKHLQLFYLNNLDFTNLKVPALNLILTRFCSFSVFDSRNFTALTQLQITNGTVGKIVIQNQVNSLILDSVVPTPEIVYNSSFFNMLQVSDTDSFSLKNSQLNHLEFLGLSNIKDVTLVNNTFTYYLISLNIIGVFNHLTLQNNTYDFDSKSKSTIIVSYINSNFQQNKQEFVGATDIHFDGNKLQNVTKTLKRVPDAQFLCLAENNFVSFSGIENDNFTTIYLSGSNHLISFQNNTLSNLNDLQLADCSDLNVFVNNTLPKLTKLNVKGSNKLKNQDLLSELTSWKSKGTNLLTLYLAKRDSSIEDKIRALFPGITIE